MKSLIAAMLIPTLAVMEISCGKPADKQIETEDAPVADPLVSGERQPGSIEQEIKLPESSASVQPAPVADQVVLTFPPLPSNGVPGGMNSWEEFDRSDYEQKYLIAFDGIDPAQELLGAPSNCSLYIIATYSNERGQPTFIVKTGFKHNEQTHSWIAVSLDSGASSALGKGMNGQDQIFIRLANPGDFLSVSRFNLKWFHINHFDTGVCENLRRR